MDVNNFGPFNADTWGSVSDWTMVIVTALTAWYLYRTLNSQTIVQGLQQKLTDIEGLRHKYEIMPVFELEKEDSLINIDDSYMSIVVNFKLTNCGKYEASDFSFKLEDGGSWKIFGGERSSRTFKVLPKGYVTVALTANIPKESIDGIGFDHYRSQFEAEISFDNLNMYRYRQKIVYSVINSDEKTSISSPEEFSF